VWCEGDAAARLARPGVPEIVTWIAPPPVGVISHAAAALA
jgi:hypothetical protein